MPRIPDDLIARIKTEIPIEQLVGETGVELRVSGKDLVGRCPLGSHEDSTASFVVTPNKSLWHCFGCDAGGDVIAWVMKTQGIGFRHAAEVLSRRLDGFGFELRTLEGPPPKLSRRPMFESPVRSRDDDQTILKRVVHFYADAGARTGATRTYLAGRGLDSPELIEHFEIGHADGTLGWHIPPSDRKEGRTIRSHLVRLGLCRGKTGKERFDGFVTFPVYDEDGNVVQVYGRRTGRPNPKWSGDARHTVLEAPLRGVWNWQCLTTAKEIVLCEAILDAATFWVHGLRNVVPAWGTNGFTADHEAAFVRHGVKAVWIAYDRDEAGEKGAPEVAAKLLALGIDCYRVQFPHGMDANDVARKIHPPARTLELALAGAAWMGKGRAPAHRTVLLGTHESRPAAAPSLAAFPLPPRYEEAAREGDCLDVVRDSGIETPIVAQDFSAAYPMVSAGTSAPKAPILLDGALSPESLTDDEAVFRFDDRRYRLRGLKKLGGSAKLSVMVSRDEIAADPSSPIPGFFADGFDLYLAKGRLSFSKQAGPEIGVKDEVVKRDIGRLFRAVEAIESQRAAKAREPKTKVPEMTAEEHADALELSSDPRYFERILQDLETCGLVGEETNKLVAWIAAASRRLERPLAIIIQSSSSAGKSALMDAVLAFIPEEEREKYSAITEKALFYLEDENALQHKVLAISEEEGAETATYALKMLQSEGVLTIASTGKNPATGEHVQHKHKVNGPVMIMLTTTKVELDEELQNRCLVLTVDEGREQTERIQRMQRKRETLEGLLAEEEKPAIRRLVQNSQRLLRPLKVMNPYAEQLEFLASRLRMRRDHEKYLTLIRSIAYLRQYQRPIKTGERKGKTFEYIEVTKDDIALANRLAGEVLGRSLDELSPQTRRFLELLDDMVTGACRQNAIERKDHWFQAKTVRQNINWSHTQVWFHLDRLTKLEYVVVHRNPRGIGFLYELVYDGEGRDGRRFLPGLIDVEKLALPDERPRPFEIIRAEEPVIRGSFGPDSAPIRASFGITNANAGREKHKDSAPNNKITLQDPEKNPGDGRGEEPELVSVAASVAPEKKSR